LIEANRKTGPVGLGLNDAIGAIDIKLRHTWTSDDSDADRNELLPTEGSSSVMVSVGRFLIEGDSEVESEDASSTIAFRSMLSSEVKESCCDAGSTHAWK